MSAMRRVRRLARSTAIAARDRWRGHDAASFRKAMEIHPLLIAPKTYNGFHPDYDRELVRNYPGRLFNAGIACNNPLFIAIKRLAFAGRVPRLTWLPVLRKAMAEARTVPGFAQVMERKAFIERYLGEITIAHQAHYSAGWVLLADAQFLYWAVRRLKPRVIVQTGVSNGLSTAFMMLALAKNGPEGRLHAIDIPAIFDPKDAAWTRKGVVYGVAIPEGRSSGWMVPDIYRDRLDLQLGDAKDLMPKLVDRLDRIDLFFHDSDHTYDHMMFEYAQAMRKLEPGGTIMADDISWNASLWDFADAHGIPGYNYRGTVGAAFFSA
jgi:predicted O-methyltransferase YrrM